MMTYQEILANAQQLTLTEKVRLLADLSNSLQHELPVTKQPKRSLLGIWEDVDISAQEIDLAHEEMWGNFPREDL